MFALPRYSIHGGKAHIMAILPEPKPAEIAQ
jgi:hypothetical protein